MTMLSRNSAIASRRPSSSAARILQESRQTPAPANAAGLRCFLLPHVFACKSEEGMFFLNARSNRYQSLSRSHLSLLQSVLAGLESTTPVGDVNPTAAEHLVAALESCGLVTRDPALGKLFDCVELSTIEIGRSFDIRFLRPTVTIVDVLRFCAASAHAALALAAVRLRFGTVDGVTRQIAKARDRAKLPGAAKSSKSMENVAALFLSVRRFFFSSTDRCLFSSLALIYFMRGYHQFPTLVIGVRITPFRPHCWVQHESIAFDIRPERLGLYLPILAI